MWDRLSVHPQSPLGSLDRPTAIAVKTRVPCALRLFTCFGEAGLSIRDTLRPHPPRPDRFAVVAPATCWVLSLSAPSVPVLFSCLRAKLQLLGD
jgi:hypothetical protein